MEIYTWCIMSSHVHLIFRAKDNNPNILLKELKTYTSKQKHPPIPFKRGLSIAEHKQESRKEWMLWLMERAGLKNSNVKHRQFWQQHNQPIELWSAAVIDQKINYIHNNPVEAGFVSEPHHWKYSSAIDFRGGKGVLEIEVAV
ncbi:transposase [Pontibacter korlensis]